MSSADVTSRRRGQQCSHRRSLGRAKAWLTGLIVVVAWTATLARSENCSEWRERRISELRGLPGLRILPPESLGIKRSSLDPEDVGDKTYRVPVLDLGPVGMHLLAVTTSNVCTAIGGEAESTTAELPSSAWRLVVLECVDDAPGGDLNCNVTTWSSGETKSVLVCQVNESLCNDTYNVMGRSACVSTHYRAGATCSVCNVPNCEACSNETHCERCFQSNVSTDSPLYVESGNCVPHRSCGNGRYGRSANRSCVDCPSNCASCSEGTGSYCFSCRNPYKLQDFKCILTCANNTVSYNGSAACIVPSELPIGYKAERIGSGLTPTACERFCLHCNDSACLSCASPSYLKAGTCATQCPLRERWRPPPMPLLLDNVTSGYVNGFNGTHWSPTCVPSGFTESQADALCRYMQLEVLLYMDLTTLATSDRPQPGATVRVDCPDASDPTSCRPGEASKDACPSDGHRLWIRCSGPPRSWQCGANAAANQPLYSKHTGLYGERVEDNFTNAIIDFIGGREQGRNPIFPVMGKPEFRCKADANFPVLLKFTANDADMPGIDLKLTAQQVSLKAAKVRLSAVYSGRVSLPPDQSSFPLRCFADDKRESTTTVDVHSYPEAILLREPYATEEPVQWRYSNFDGLMFTLRCTGYGGTGTTVTWKNISGSVDPALPTARNTSAVQVRASLGAVLYCEASNGLGNKSSELVVVGQRNDSYWLNSSLTYDWGSAVNLSVCNITLNGARLPGDWSCVNRSDASLNVTDGALQLFSGAVCSCTVMSTLVTGQQNITFVVPDPVKPNVSFSEFPEDVTESNYTHIECAASGHPAPSITWQYCNVTVDSDSRNTFCSSTTRGFREIVTSSKSGTGVYNVTSALVGNATRKHSGHIRCVADSAYGSALGSTKSLYVRYTPAVTILSEAISQGLDAKFECHSDAFPTTTKITWVITSSLGENSVSRNITEDDYGQLSNCSLPGNNQSGASNDSDRYCVEAIGAPDDENAFHPVTGLRLVIRAFSVKDEGMVTCVAINPVGDGQAHIYAALPKPPPDYSLTIGLSVSMTFVFVVLVIIAALIYRKRGQICDSEALPTVKAGQGRAMSTISGITKLPKKSRSKKKDTSDATTSNPAASMERQETFTNISEGNGEGLYECPEGNNLIAETPDLGAGLLGAADKSLLVAHAGAAAPGAAGKEPSSKKNNSGKNDSKRYVSRPQARTAQRLPPAASPPPPAGPPPPMREPSPTCDDNYLAPSPNEMPPSTAAVPAGPSRFATPSPAPPAAVAGNNSGAPPERWTPAPPSFSPPPTGGGDDADEAEQMYEDLPAQDDGANGMGPAVDEEEGDGELLYEDLPAQASEDSPLDAQPRKQEGKGLMAWFRGKNKNKKEDKAGKASTSLPPAPGRDADVAEGEPEDVYDTIDVDMIRQQQAAAAAGGNDAGDGAAGDDLYECLPEGQEEAEASGGGGDVDEVEEEADETTYEDPSLMAVVTVASAQQRGSSSGSAERRALPAFPPQQATTGATGGARQQATPSPSLQPPPNPTLPPPPGGSSALQRPTPPAGANSNDKPTPHQSYQHTDIRFGPPAPSSAAEKKPAEKKAAVVGTSYQFAEIRAPPKKGSGVDKPPQPAAVSAKDKNKSLERGGMLKSMFGGGGAGNKTASLPLKTKPPSKASFQPPPPRPPKEEEIQEDIYEEGDIDADDYLPMDIAAEAHGGAATQQDDDDAELYLPMDSSAQPDAVEDDGDLYLPMDINNLDGGEVTDELYLPMECGANPEEEQDELYLPMDMDGGGGGAGSDNGSEELYLDMDASAQDDGNDGAASGELYMAMDSEEQQAASAPPPPAAVAAAPPPERPSSSKPVGRSPSSAKLGARSQQPPPPSQQQPLQFKPPPGPPASALLGGKNGRQQIQAGKTARPQRTQQAPPSGPQRPTKKAAGGSGGANAARSASPSPAAPRIQMPLPPLGAKPEAASPAAMPSRDDKKGVDGAKWQGQRRTDIAAAAPAQPPLAPPSVGRTPSARRAVPPLQTPPPASPAPPPGRVRPDKPGKAATSRPPPARQWPPKP